MVNLLKIEICRCVDQITDDKASVICRGNRFPMRS